MDCRGIYLLLLFAKEEKCIAVSVLPLPFYCRPLLQNKSRHSKNAFACLLDNIDINIIKVFPPETDPVCTLRVCDWIRDWDMQIIDLFTADGEK